MVVSWKLRKANAHINEAIPVLCLKRFKERVKESLQIHICIVLLDVTMNVPVSNKLKGLYFRNEKTPDE